MGTFYGRFIESDPAYYGRPSFDRVRDLLSPRLLQLAEDQAGYEAQCIREAPPGLKPHMIDQNPFFLAPDGVEEVVEVKPWVSGSRAEVIAVLSDEGYVWRDTVELELIDGNWLIVDIHWGNNGSLANRLERFMYVECGG